MKKTLLFGEPMALLLADTPGALECVLQNQIPGSDPFPPDRYRWFSVLP